MIIQPDYSDQMWRKMVELFRSKGLRRRTAEYRATTLAMSMNICDDDMTQEQQIGWMEKLKVHVQQAPLHVKFRVRLAYWLKRSC